MNMCRSLLLLVLTFMASVHPEKVLEFISGVGQPIGRIPPPLTDGRVMIGG